MTEQEQIEEMEKDIVRSAGLGVYEKAKYLTDLGYQKIDDKCAVITKDELNLYKKQREEIDILTKVYASSKRKQTKKQFLETIAELQKQVNELTEQKAFWEGMHDRVSLKLEEYDDKSDEYENALVVKQCRITELQKQVDELTERAEQAEEIANVYQSESTTKCWVDYAVKQAVKEFAEKLKEKFEGYEATCYNGVEEGWHDLKEEIDDLLKEYER